MLTREDIEEIEGDVGAALKFANVEDDTPPDLDAICHELTGSCFQLAAMRVEGRTKTRDGGRVLRCEVRLDLVGTPRERQVKGHELGHVWGRKFLRREVSEEWCDAFGAMLASPRRTMRRALAAIGHRPSRLASALRIEPEAALLRIGEVTDRPVALVRRPGLIVPRGEEYPWPLLREVLQERPAGIHPVRVGARWGMMRAA